MKNENLKLTIEQQVERAKTDSLFADEFILQYMPFIKSEAAKTMKRPPDEGDDELSISMFAFYEAIMAYAPGRGSFLNLASMMIKSRLIDHFRKEERHRGNISLETPASEDDGRTLGDTISDREDKIQNLHEKSAATEEIAEFAKQLSLFGLSLSDIADNCPKQKRTFDACMKVLDFARNNEEIFNTLLETKKLPISKISNGAKVDKKTLERHRKYIVAILIAFTNGYEIIRGHLKMIKRKEA